VKVERLRRPAPVHLGAVEKDQGVAGDRRAILERVESLLAKASEVPASVSSTAYRDWLAAIVIGWPDRSTTVPRIICAAASDGRNKPVAINHPNNCLIRSPPRLHAVFAKRMREDDVKTRVNKIEDGREKTCSRLALHDSPRPFTPGSTHFHAGLHAFLHAPLHGVLHVFDVRTTLKKSVSQPP
jgi:hypothetical protein